MKLDIAGAFNAAKNGEVVTCDEHGCEAIINDEGDFVWLSTGNRVRLIESTLKSSWSIVDTWTPCGWDEAIKKFFDDNWIVETRVAGTRKTEWRRIPKNRVLYFTLDRQFRYRGATP